MYDVIKKLAVALVAGLCLTVTGSFAHGTHGDKDASCCAGSSSSKACDSSTAACPTQTAALPECCRKTAAGNRQACCAKHAAGQRQACCEQHAQVTAAPCCAGQAAAAPGCCKGGATQTAVDPSQLSPSMQNLMQKVDELRRRRQ